ncbi:ATP-dependent RNA helicase rok1 [Venturia nashicola]|uniref:ATP-dependent RNA helicase ROK1 n=1 Tax=Venturia nashicola TaxID=86259 RepID=A0A4Z1PRI8_9PEZI|nr:ATP-dependent RNA helicase rok1 [Venturia nashicola]
MDIFKLLSRSAKVNSKRKSTSTRLDQKLPSSGGNSNPQLFGKDEQPGNPASANGPSVLGKRKRGKGEPLVAEELPAELDFFGGSEKTAGKCRKKNVQDAARSKAQEEVAVQTTEEEEELDEENCKATLRAHKIKVSVLAEADTMANDKKKKSKSKKEEPNHKRALYPKPLTSFPQLQSRYPKFSKRLAENISNQGYTVPTEVQLASLPLLMGDSAEKSEGQDHERIGCNLLAVAPTGSGKTLAFMIPVLSAIIKERGTSEDEGVRALIVAPTRELANQIVNEGKKLAENTGVKISLVRKGMKIGGQVEAEETSKEATEVDGSDSEEASDEEDTKSVLRKKTSTVKSHILVSTPLALIHALQGLDGQPTTLPSVRYLVLDEADVLLDPLFREQTLAIWRSCAKETLITTLWSATMGSSIEDLALKYIPQNAYGNHMSTVRLVVGLKDTALPTLNHILTYAATETGKLLALRQLLHPTAPETDSAGRKALRPPLIVFTQTIERAKALHAELRYDIPPEAGGSSRIAALHSEMSETARAKVMTEFRKGEIWIIITTDLLARGVDFRGLNGVVNYDVPTSAAAYVHRVGRTGRAGREGGVAVTFYTKEDIPFVKPIANVIRASEKLRGDDGAKSSVQQWLLDALPMPSKNDRKEIKLKGLEARRSGKKSARISTKSGFDRRQNSKKGDGKGRVEKSKARIVREKTGRGNDGDDFGGFSD